MNFKIEILDTIAFEKYERFLKSVKGALLYYSLKYKQLIEDYIKAESYYFLAINGKEEIVGVFPLMIINNEKLGKVANSLPYYGSNGSILLGEKLDSKSSNIVRKLLLDCVLAKIDEEQCIAATFITNPFDKECSNWFEQNLAFNFKDYRIGQITELPQIKENIDAALMAIYSNPRPRNIRKAIKSGVEVYFSNSKEDMDFLYEVHKDNIESIGGKSKEKRFFDNVLNIMEDNDYKIIMAKKDGELIAGLLVFYFHETVEYFTPATVYKYRNLQPSSLLIFEGMKQAIKDGYKYWNWGGTWSTQEGVYDFKKRWGSKDYQYEYYTIITDESILEYTANQIAAEFPHAFVIPFEKLK